MSSHQEEINESSCKDEEDEMTIVVKRYKKLVLQKSKRMRRGNSSNKINSRVILQGAINFYNKLGYLKNDFPLNKEAKKYKKKKILVET